MGTTATRPIDTTRCVGPAEFTTPTATRRRRRRPASTPTTPGTRRGGWPSAHPAAGLVSLVYDARGKRVSKQAMDRTVIVFIYDFDRLLKETDASGDTETSFTSTDQGWGT